jgi:DNA-binding IclR family transcriptional regulator
MNKYMVPNLGKAVQTLKLLSAAGSGLSAVQIEKELSIPRTTAFRILKTLTYEGMVEKKGPQFFASAGLFEMGLQALSKSNLRELAVPLLQELTRQTGQTSHLAIPSGWYSLILEVCDSPHPVQVASRPGTLADLHCSATGKIFLSSLYRDRLKDYCEAVKPAKRTGNTKTSYEELTVMAENVRLAGYAQDEEEYHPGVRCLAAPIFDMRAEVVASMGVTGPVTSYTEDKFKLVKECVLNACISLSKSLGYAMD